MYRGKDDAQKASSYEIRRANTGTREENSNKHRCSFVFYALPFMISRYQIYRSAFCRYKKEGPIFATRPAEKHHCREAMHAIGCSALGNARTGLKSTTRIRTCDPAYYTQCKGLPVIPYTAYIHSL